MRNSSASIRLSALWNSALLVKKSKIYLLLLLAAGLLMTPLFGFFSSSASAQEDRESIRGTLQITVEEEKALVAGAEITVRQNGAVIGTGTSGNDGKWEIPVPGPGTYSVSIDTGSLPDGVALRDSKKQELPEIQVREGQNKAVIFALGEGISSSVSRAERVADLFFAGLRLGAIIAMASVGLSLVYGTTKLVNFAHGEIITLGAVIAFFLNTSGGGPSWHLLVVIVPAAVITAVISGGMEEAIWRPVRKRGVPAASAMIVSIGLSLAIRYTIQVLIGSNSRSYRNYSIQEPWEFLWFSQTPKSVIIVISAVLILGASGLMLLYTKFGTAIRAVVDNKDLAQSSGINVQNTILSTWVFGAFLAALSGIMLGIAEGVEYEMGFQILIFVFAAVILGGLGTSFGAMLGGFLVGIFVEMSTYWIDAEFKPAMALGLIVVILIFRPQGILGKRERKG